MARLLKLYWGAVEKVDLQAVADAGWRLAPRGWTPKSGRPGTDAPVVETMEFIVDRASDDNLATSLQAMDEVRYWAQRYMADPTAENPVWLWAKMDGETGTRRALVRSIAMEWLSDPMSATDYAAGDSARVRLKIEREPWWEETTITSASALLAETSGTMLELEYTTGGTPHNVAGDVPARIPHLAVYSDGSGANVARLWMGFRSANKHSTINNFEPVWECEDGTNNASESGVTDDAGTDVNGASPGGGSGVFVKLAETDLDWDDGTNGNIFQEVLELKLSDISTDEQDHFGDYLWLLRTKLAANATVWEVQLRWGYSGMADADFVQGPIVEVSGTSWDYAEMGRMQIPLRDHQALELAFVAEGFEAAYAVQIWAKRTSGAADLYLDCLCPLPIDEGWLKSWDFDLPAGSAAHWVLGEGAAGAVYAAAYGAGSLLSHIAALATDDFRMPVGDGHLYIVYAGATAHDFTVGISTSTFSYYERWANLRGAD